MEKEKQETQDTDSTMRELKRQEQLLAYLAHEIRMPLQGVYASLHHCSEQEEISSQMRQELESAIAQTEYVVELLNDVLDVSQLRNGGLKKRIEATTREEFQSFLQQRLAPMARDKGILFESHVQESPYAYLYLDAQKLQQILINLVGNAVKHAKPQLLGKGAKITLTCRYTKTEVNRVGMMLSIADNGKGMEQDVLEQIYTPFLMGNAEEHRRSAGLGMTIVKYLVELLGGKIYMESKPEVGTKATIRMECDGADEWYGTREENYRFSKGIQSAGRLSSNLKNLHILVAEDEELAIDALERDMKALQMKVDKTYDGEEAVDIFAQTKEGYYDLLLFDYEMPEKDGLEAAREIRQMNRDDSQHVPIFIMSGNLGEEIERAAADGVISAWIQKPFGMGQLQGLMEQHLGEEA